VQLQAAICRAMRWAGASLKRTEPALSTIATPPSSHAMSGPADQLTTIHGSSIRS
jgi:hypothetical protein